MLYVSRETPEKTRSRLLRVIAAARLDELDGWYTFEEWPVDGAPPALDARTVAAVRDDEVWSLLRPAAADTKSEKFGLIRFHFPAGLDNSGFVGWLATHLKQSLGTGVFVICGQNSDHGGIFDYTGFPAALREHVLQEIRTLREEGADLVPARRPPRARSRTTVEDFRLYHVDAFSNEPFRGNPAAVVLLETPAPEEWMQAVAAEMMVSATAFVAIGSEPFSLRWFTPVTELKLCGHGTLAAAHVLWTEELVEPGRTLLFESQSGGLSASASKGWIELDFPAERARTAPTEERLLSALGVQSVIGVARNRMDVLVELETEAAVRSLRPDLAALAQVPARGVIVTAVGEGDRYDFVSRFFAPSIGVSEDPVTGSAHCCLGPYWSERLGRDDLMGYQASRRGGSVRVRVAGSRVVLGGQAITIVRGSLRSCGST